AATKLDLAQAYIDMGDSDGAREEAGTVKGDLSGIPARRPYNARLWYIIRLSLLGKYR
ncbi:FimV/HubP family polar landmark protein, partial [Pseudomonas sp. FW305-70]|uniref:FimV/HubP family polar landmark protein n=1 Tax=Pseudomonas sp. FW305-70 TaxID=2751342 RepID=UPI000CB0BBFE